MAAPDTLEPELFRDDACTMVDLTRVSHIPFILLKRGHAIRKRADSVFKRCQVTPKVLMEVSSCISAVQLAAAGLGLTIVPQRAVDVLGGVSRFGCYHFSDEAEQWDVNVVYKEDTYLDRAERQFIDLMKEVFGENA